jgi:SpoVK/Ycf46/Vps4 family AAA+-type ATPase
MLGMGENQSGTMARQPELLFVDGPDSEANNTQAMATPAPKSTARRAAAKPVKSPALIPLSLARDNRFTHLIEAVEPRHDRDAVILSPANTELFRELITEFRHGDTLRRHGLPVIGKLLFCGPPGCGKTLMAEVFARETGLPLLVARLDTIISSFLGETASNLRKLFDEIERRPCVLFLDEFDALARTRNDSSEHSEMRRVVNSLLMLIDRYHGRGFVIAATNVEQSLDSAIWRRFDEVVVFDLPDSDQIARLIALKTRNFAIDFDLAGRIAQLEGSSFAEIERICLSAIKRAILKGDKSVSADAFDQAMAEGRRRRDVQTKLKARHP